MIKDGGSFPIDIVYSQDIELRTYAKYKVSWKALGFNYLTCGATCNKVECVQFIESTVKILDENNTEISLNQFNQFNKEEELDLSCNCHGFTFSYGKYFINDRYVAPILSDEYEVVEDQLRINKKDFDVVVLYDINGNVIHSARLKFDLFLHKEGIRKFSAVKTLEEITSIPDYQNLIPKFYKKKDRNCDGFCLHSIGEDPENKFSNDNKY